MSDLTQLIAGVGFPAAVAAFLIAYLTRSLNGKLNTLAVAVEHNTEATRMLAERIEGFCPLLDERKAQATGEWRQLHPERRKK